MSDRAPQPPAQEEEPWNPPGPQPLSIEEFATLNTNATRAGIADQEMSICDGFIPLGRNNLRTLPDAVMKYTAPGGLVIDFLSSGNIAGTSFVFAIMSDGSIIAVNTVTFAATTIATAGSVSPIGQNTGFAQWGPSLVIIVSQVANGYYLWDGTTLYGAGDAVPGYGTIPSGLSGACVTSYQSRVWIASENTITFSAPGDPTDFTTADGGGSFVSNDPYLVVKYYGLVSTNGFLFLTADSSVDYISGVQTGGTPVTTTFTKQNADPQNGSAWPLSIGVVGRDLIVANITGVYSGYGGALTKISAPMDGLYSTYVSPGPVSSGIPSFARAIIYGRPLWMMLMPLLDQSTGTPKNKLIMMMNGGKVWWTSNQTPNLVAIVSTQLDSLAVPYGADATNIYQLFAAPSTTLRKTWQSKLWDRPGGLSIDKYTSRLWGAVEYNASSSPNIIVSIDNETEANNPYTITNSGTTVGITVFKPTAVAQNGVYAGMTVATSELDVTMIKFGITVDPWQYRG